MKSKFVLMMTAVCLAAFTVFLFSGASSSAERVQLTEKFAYSNQKTDEASGTYDFDRAHSSIGFRIKHMGLVDVPGYFRDFTGKINYDASDVTKSSVEFTAKMESVDTGIEGRDKHLRSPDFFEVEKFPEMTFKSTKVEKRGDNLLVTGDFSMKGVTKQISFPVTVAGFLKDQRGGTRMGAVAQTVINRRDFGVNYGGNLPNGSPMLADDVRVELNIEAVMPAPKPAEETEKKN
jgi:polyisoprenoid-binding protein YceI